MVEKVELYFAKQEFRKLLKKALRYSANDHRSSWTQCLFSYHDCKLFLDISHGNSIASYFESNDHLDKFSYIFKNKEFCNYESGIRAANVIAPNFNGSLSELAEMIGKPLLRNKNFIVSESVEDIFFTYATIKDELIFQ